jgi:hypothetical protein
MTKGEGGLNTSELYDNNIKRPSKSRETAPLNRGLKGTLPRDKWV